MIFRTFTQAYNLLRNKNVKFTTKLIYLLLTVTYTLAPTDLLPFLPFDDFFVIWIATRFFVSIASGEAGLKKKRNIFNIFNKKKYDMDAKGEFVDEEDEERG